MQLFEGKLIVQTLFVRGSYLGKAIDNTRDEEIVAWIAALRKIKPQFGDVYTHRQRNPGAEPRKNSLKELEKIAPPTAGRDRPSFDNSGLKMKQQNEFVQDSQVYTKSDYALEHETTKRICSERPAKSDRLLMLTNPDSDRCRNITILLSALAGIAPYFLFRQACSKHIAAKPPGCRLPETIKLLPPL